MNDTNSQNARSLFSLLRAVEECRQKPLGDPQRIIVVLAPPGGGLTQKYRQALRQRGALLVPAGLMDRSRVRFIKLLAHRTRFVPVVLAIAEDWRRWYRRQPIPAAQIRRRIFMMSELVAHSIAEN
jgi:hypothetical protein